MERALTQEFAAKGIGYLKEAVTGRMSGDKLV